MPAKLAPPSVVRTIAPHVPEPVRHRAVPSSHHSSRLTAVNELGLKSAGMAPPAGPGVVVVVELVEVVEGVVVVVEVVDLDMVVVVVVVEVAVVLLQAAAVRARAASATPISP
jgi:hypothetical protein